MNTHPQPLQHVARQALLLFLFIALGLTLSTTQAQNGNNPPPGTMATSEASYYICTNTAHGGYGYYSVYSGYGYYGYYGGNNACYFTNVMDVQDVGPNCTPTSSSSCAYCSSEEEQCCEGMPQWRVEEPGLSLYLQDTPLFYNTSRGRKVSFSIHYKGTPGGNGQTDNAQPALFSFGTNWYTKWRSYLQKSTFTNPQSGDETFFAFLGDGSARQYPVNQTEQYSRATLLHTNNEYWLTFASGARNVYGQFVTINGNEYIFLSKLIDANSNQLSFTYTCFTDAGLTNAIRLQKITDEDGLETTFSYASHAYFSNMVTAVNGPHSLTASLGYDPQGRLTNLTDVVGLRCHLLYYGSSQKLSQMITPYGTNTFSYPSDSGVTGILIDELGLRKQLYIEGIYRANALPTAASEASSLNSYLGAVSTMPTSGYDLCNTYYWGPRQYQNVPGAIQTIFESGSINSAFISTNVLKLARTRHWLQARRSNPAETNVVASHTLCLERTPSPDDDGTSEGSLTLYDYAGKDDGTAYDGNWIYAPPARLPKTIARRIPGGTWEVQRFTRNSLGKPTRVDENFNFRDGIVDGVWEWGVAWRTNIYLYADNGVDEVSHHFATGTDIHLHSSNVFNGYHQVVTNYNALSEVTYFEYNSAQQITKMTNAAGLIVDYSYDGNGFLASKVERSITNYFRTNAFTWSSGRLWKQTDPRGSVTTNTYDNLGRLTESANEDGTIRHYYDKLDRVRTLDRMGFTNGFGYNGFRQLVYLTNANFRVTTNVYCNCGALDTMVDPLGGTTSFSYDNLGRRKRTTHPDSSWEENVYDALGRVERVQTSAGGITTNIYALRGLLHRQDAPLGTVYRAFHDAEDRATNTMSADSVLTFTEYDLLGRVTNTHQVDYDFYLWEPDLWEYRTVSFTHSPRGVVAREDELGKVSRYFFDELGRKTIETNALGDRVLYAYSPEGDLLTLTDGKSQNTTWKYDYAGRVTNKLDHNGLVIFRYAYDANGRLTSRVTPANGSITTSYSYDAVGNLTFVNYPNSPDLTFKYDALNRLTNMLDGVGTTTYSYTNFGAVIGEDGPWDNDQVNTTYTNRLRATLSLAQPYGGNWTQGYGYDPGRRMTGLSSPAGAFGYSYRSYSHYYEQNWLNEALVYQSQQVSRVDLATGSYVENTHDVFARLTATHLKNNGGTHLNSHEYAYDAANRRTSQARSGGTTVDYVYDDLGQLLDATGVEPFGTTNRVHEQFHYLYDAAGNLSYRTNNTLVQTFNVDSLNQLTSASRSGNATVAGGTTIAASSVTVNANGGGAVSAIRYADRTFARTNVSLVNGDNTFVATAQDGLGRTATQTETVYLPSSVTYVYDSNGNLRSDGRRHFTYDDENQLTRVVVTNVSNSGFAYDGKLRRRLRTEATWVNGSWVTNLLVRYVYDGNLVLQERHFDVQLGTPLPQRLVAHTRGLDLIGSIEGAGGIGGLLVRSEAGSPPQVVSHAYYHADAVGNITTLVDTNQQVVARCLYAPFGGLMAMSGALAEANLQRFSSKEVHEQSGLVYYLYRFYDPNLQRWPNRDPLNEFGFNLLIRSQNPFNWNEEKNLYGFARNNPVVYYDADGRIVPVIIVGGVAIGAAEAAAAAFGLSLTACMASPPCAKAVRDAIAQALDKCIPRSIPKPQPPPCNLARQTVDRCYYICRYDDGTSQTFWVPKPSIGCPDTPPKYPSKP